MRRAEIPPEPCVRAVLRLDSGAGALVGLGVLALHPYLAALYGLPAAVVLFTGAANLVYATGSGTLVWRCAKGRGVPRWAAQALVGANLAWAGVCAALLVRYGGAASALGVAVLVLEGLFVGALGLVERRVLLSPRASGPVDGSRP